jgi:hypothetical protein
VPNWYIDYLELKTLKKLQLQKGLCGLLFLHVAGHKDSFGRGVLSVPGQENDFNHQRLVIGATMDLNK